MVAALLTPVPCSAQVAPGSPSGQPAADDTPAVKVGGTLFADYTVVQAPEITDGDRNTVVANAFNVGRAYINVTGRISHLISFRITPDIFREAGPGSSLNGSYVFRLSYGTRSSISGSRQRRRMARGFASGCSRRRGSTSSNRYIATASRA